MDYNQWASGMIQVSIQVLVPLETMNLKDMTLDYDFGA